MPNFNQMTLVGHVGRDPEVRHTAAGQAVTQFSMAYTRKVKGQDATTWFQVSAWNKTGEIAAQYVRKGAPVMVVGEVTLREYTTQAGEKRASLELTADRLTLLGGRDSGGDTTQERPARSEAPTTRAVQRTPEAGLPAGAGDLDDIPF